MDESASGSDDALVRGLMIVALDADIRERLRVGAVRGASLPAPARAMLTVIFEGGRFESAFSSASAGRVGLLRRWRARRRVRELEKTGLVRREDDRFVLTVLGLGAVRPGLVAGPDRALLTELRAARRAEIRAGR